MATPDVWRKLNLTSQSEIVVLNAPESLAPALGISRVLPFAES
jgi:hypothetical protein